MTLIDDFEDNNISVESGTNWSGWSGDTGSFSAQSSVSLSGTYSGALDGALNVVSATRSSEVAEGVVLLAASNSTNTTEEIRIRDSSSTAILEVHFTGSGSIDLVTPNSTTLLGSYSTDTAYEIGFSIDWQTDEFRLFIDGVQQASGNLSQSFSGQAEVWLRAASSGGTLYVDDVETQATPAPSLTVSQGDEDEIDLSWTDPASDTQGYVIYRAESSGSSLGDYTQIDDIGGGSTTYTDTGREDGEEYFYRIRTYNLGGTSDLSNEDSATAVLPAATIDSVDDTGNPEITVDWTKEDDSSDGSWEIYRSTDGSLGTLQDTITNLSTTQYADSSVSADTTYFYTVRRVTDHASADVQVDGAADLPAPTNLSVDAVNGDQFDLSWDDNATAEDGYRVYLSRDGGSTYSQDGSDLAADSTTYTTTNLLDGEEYTIEVRAFVAEDDEYASSTVTETTVLPDVATPTLGNGVEDEIEVTWSDVIDYGSYRIEYRETGASTWIDDGTEGEATTSHNITGLEDGEEYEVRMRTETEHVNGAWTSPVSIVTKFPGASNLSVDSVGQTAVDLSWTDNADNEDGFDLQHRKKLGGSFGPWRDIKTLSPNTTSATDDTVSPEREYEWRIRAFTEHTDAFSNTVGDTTNSAGVRQRDVPAQGWYVEIDIETQ